MRIARSFHLGGYVSPVQPRAELPRELYIRVGVVPPGGVYPLLPRSLGPFSLGPFGLGPFRGGVGSGFCEAFRLDVLIPHYWSLTLGR